MAPNPYAAFADPADDYSSFADQENPGDYASDDSPEAMEAKGLAAGTQALAHTAVAGTAGLIGKGYGYLKESAARALGNDESDIDPEKTAAAAAAAIPGAPAPGSSAAGAEDVMGRAVGAVGEGVNAAGRWLTEPTPDMWAHPEKYGYKDRQALQDSVDQLRAMHSAAAETANIAGAAAAPFQLARAGIGAIKGARAPVPRVEPPAPVPPAPVDGPVTAADLKASPEKLTPAAPEPQARGPLHSDFVGAKPGQPARWDENQQRWVDRDGGYVTDANGGARQPGTPSKPKITPKAGESAQQAAARQGIAPAAPEAPAAQAAPASPRKAIQQLNADTGGALPEVRTSALNGDHAETAVDHAHSTIEDEPGRRMAGVIKNENAALTKASEQTVDSTGGQESGTDKGALQGRGTVIDRALGAIRDWFDTNRRKMYADANAAAGGVPMTKFDNFNGVMSEPSYFTGAEGMQLHGDVQRMAQRFGLQDGNGFWKPTTAENVEKFRQWVGEQYSPRTGKAIRLLKDALDNDVAAHGGENFYKGARALREKQAAMLERENSISRLIPERNPDGTLSTNRPVAVADLPDHIAGLHEDQFNHLINTLHDSAKLGNGELAETSAAAIRELKAHMAERLHEAGIGKPGSPQRNSGRWDSAAYHKKLDSYSLNLPKLFTPGEQARIRTVRDAGNALHMDKSYPKTAELQRRLAAGTGSHFRENMAGTIVGGAESLATLGAHAVIPGSGVLVGPSLELSGVSNRARKLLGGESKAMKARAAEVEGRISKVGGGEPPSNSPAPTGKPPVGGAPPSNSPAPTGKPPAGGAPPRSSPALNTLGNRLAGGSMRGGPGGKTGPNIIERVRNAMAPANERPEGFPSDEEFAKAHQVTMEGEGIKHQSAQHPVTHQVGTDIGGQTEHAFKSGPSTVLAHERPDGSLQIHGSMTPGAESQGYGSSAYNAAVKHSLDTAGAVHSDAIVSKDAIRRWKALGEREGNTLHENPTNETTASGGVISRDTNPSFTLTRDEKPLGQNPAFAGQRGSVSGKKVGPNIIERLKGKKGTKEYQANKELEDFVKKSAPLHHVTETGPTTWEELQAQGRGAKSLPINPQGGEGSIYSDTPTNMAFRAWHDKLHLEHNAGFDHEGELKVAQEHQKAAELAGLSREARRALWADTWETFKHHEDTGEFPKNPRAFVAEQMKKQFPGDQPAQVNIGLHVNGGPAKGGSVLDARVARAALKAQGVDIAKSSIQNPPGGEPTLVADINRPLTEPEGRALGQKTGQDSIAQRHADGSGRMFVRPGKEAIAEREGWKDYNPDYFQMHDGRVATEHDAENTAFDQIKPHMTPEEIASIENRTPKNRATAIKNLVDVFHSSTSAMGSAAMALAGQAKKGWYKASGKAIHAVYGPDAPRFTALLAAMSPQTSVEMNFHNAIRVFKAWDEAGRPTDHAAITKIMEDNSLKNPESESESNVMEAWRQNGIRALTSKDPEHESFQLSGPKVNSFYQNLRDNVHEVTNDSWNAIALNVAQSLFGGAYKKVAGDIFGKLGFKSPGYIGASAKVRAAADLLTKMTGDKWTPHETQETMWSFAKTAMEYNENAAKEAKLKGLPKPEDKTIPQLIKEGLINDDLIRSTPDFAHLFGAPEHSDVFATGRFAKGARKLAAEQKRSPAGSAAPSEKSQAAAAALRPDLLEQADRLEGIRQQRIADKAAGRKERQIGNIQVPF